MKDKILHTTLIKLKEGFKTNFLTRAEFEKEFGAISNTQLETLTSWVKSYQELIAAEDESVIKLSKEQFILREFNSVHRKSYNYGYGYSDKYKTENLEELKSSNNEAFVSYSNAYNDKLKAEAENIVVPFQEFISTKTDEQLSSISEERDNTINLTKMFWKFFHKTYFGWEWGARKREDIKEIRNSPEKAILRFTEDYLSNTYIKLYERASKALSNVNFSGFETNIVNVGNRNVESNRGGWVTNNFQVINNGKNYTFISSTKNGKQIKGEFINIFILLSNKRHLQKISVTLDEVEQTPYIIWKDFEKVSLKDECEIYIEKHHGNETIIFDSEKQALDFQAKIIEIKESSPNRKTKY